MECTHILQGMVGSQVGRNFVSRRANTSINSSEKIVQTKGSKREIF